MSKIIDIRSKITNDLPAVQISESLVVTVNNRKSTILSIQAMVKEKELKLEKEGKEEYDELAFMSKIMEQLITKKSVEAIEELDLPFPEYKELYNTLMNVATGNYSDTPTE